MKRLFVVGITAASVLLGSLALAAKPPAETPLVVSFGNGAADALRSDGYIAPGFAADYANGLENILAILQASGNFRFTTQNDTRASAQRHVCIDFRLQSVPFAPAQCVNVLQPMHSYTTGDVAIQSLRYGSAVRKLTRFAWDDGPYRYRLGYGTDMDMDGQQDSPAVNVTCIAPADINKACSTWVLAPEGDGTAALFRFPLTQSRKDVMEGAAELVGTYVMPFAQTFSIK